MALKVRGGGLGGPAAAWTKNNCLQGKGLSGSSEINFASLELCFNCFVGHISRRWDVGYEQKEFCWKLMLFFFSEINPLWSRKVCKK